MAECNFTRLLHDVADKLQALSHRLQDEETIRGGLGHIVSQAVEYAETFERTLTEKKKQLSDQGVLLEQAKKLEDVDAEVLKETLNQTQTSFVSTQRGILKIREDVHKLFLGTAFASCEDGKNIEPEDAADDYGRAKELDGQAYELARQKGKKRERPQSDGAMGARKRTRRFEKGQAVLKAVTAAVWEADFFRERAKAKRNKATSWQTETIGALEDVKKMLASLVTAFDDVVSALKNMDDVLKKALLAKDRRATKGQLKKLKKALERVRGAMKGTGGFAVQN